MIPENKLPPLASIPNEHHRSDVNTYLNIPVWSKIIVKQDFFHYFSNNNTKNFPYLKSIGLYWRYYFKSLKLTNKINIIPATRLFIGGLLFTTEYLSKLTYDSIVSLLNVRKEHQKSSKEQLIDTMLHEYLEFLKNNEWHDFDFYSRLKAYSKFKRQEGEKIYFSEMEKNIFLFLSFSFKQCVAQLIKLKNKLNYTNSTKTTVVELDYYPPEFEYNLEINVVGEYQKHVLLEFPRYRGIKEYIRKIDLKNNLYSIAGNSGNIVVSCLFQDEINPSLIKIPPIIINKENDRGEIRALYVLPINYLQGFLKYCHNKKIIVEHILDY